MKYRTVYAWILFIWTKHLWDLFCHYYQYAWPHFQIFAGKLWKMWWPWSLDWEVLVLVQPCKVNLLIIFAHSTTKEPTQQYNKVGTGELLGNVLRGNLPVATGITHFNGSSCYLPYQVSRYQLFWGSHVNQADLTPSSQILAYTGLFESSLYGNIQFWKEV